MGPLRGGGPGWGEKETKHLNKATDWLWEQGFKFEYVNCNVHGLTGFGPPHFPRKVFAHVYIDDRNLGGFPGWDKVLEELL